MAAPLSEVMDELPNRMHELGEAIIRALKNELAGRVDPLSNRIETLAVSQSKDIGDAMSRVHTLQNTTDVLSEYVAELVSAVSELQNKNERLKEQNEWTQKQYNELFHKVQRLESRTFQPQYENRDNPLPTLSDRLNSADYLETQNEPVFTLDSDMGPLQSSTSRTLRGDSEIAQASSIPASPGISQHVERSTTTRKRRLTNHAATELDTEVEPETLPVHANNPKRKKGTGFSAFTLAETANELGAASSESEKIPRQASFIQARIVGDTVVGEDNVDRPEQSGLLSAPRTSTSRSPGKGVRFAPTELDNSNGNEIMRSESPQDSARLLKQFGARTSKSKVVQDSVQIASGTKDSASVTDAVSSDNIKVAKDSKSPTKKKTSKANVTKQSTLGGSAPLTGGGFVRGGEGRLRKTPRQTPWLLLGEPEDFRIHKSLETPDL